MGLIPGFLIIVWGYGYWLQQQQQLLRSLQSSASLPG